MTATTGAPGTRPAARRGLGLLVLLAALGSFGPLSLDLYLPAFPQIATYYGTDTGAVQLTFSAALVGLGAGQILWGPTSDRYGRKRPMLAGLSLFVVASLLIAVAPGFTALVALRFLQAVGGSAGIVISRAIVRDLYSGRELARAMATIMSVFTLAPAIAPVIGWAVLLVAPWQGTFVALAFFGVAGLVGVLSLHETLEPARRTTHGFVGAMHQYGTILGTSSFRYTAAVAALGSVAIFAYVSASPAVFIDSYGVDRGMFTLLFAGLSLLLILGAQINRRLLKGRQVVPVLRASVAVQVVASAFVLLAALLAVHVGVLLLPLGGALMTVVAVNSNAISLSIDPFPRSAASAAALVGGLQQGFAGITSALLSALAFAPAVEMGAAMLAASSVSLGLLALYRRRGGGVPTP